MNREAQAFLKETNLYFLNKTDLKMAAKLMADAFYSDPSIRYLLGGDGLGKNDWRYFYVLLKALHGRAVMVSFDKEINEFAMALPPSVKGVPALPFLFKGGLLLPFYYKRGMFVRSLRYESNCQKIKKRFIDKDTWYFMALVVRPSIQYQGRGSKLAKHLVDYLNNNNKSLYLETHKEINVKLYQKHGFEIKDISVIPKTDKKQYAMIWTPKK